MKSFIRKRVKKKSLASIIVISILLAVSACGDDSSEGDTSGNNGNNTTPDNEMTWSAPELLESSDFNVHDMDVAASGSDSFVAVWNQDTAGSMEAVYASEVTGSGDWTDAEKISNDVFAVHDGPEIDVNSNGIGLVVWGETNNISPLASQRSLAYSSANGFGLNSELIYSSNVNMFMGGNVHVADSGDAVFAGDLNARIWAASYSSSWSGGDNIDDGSGAAFETALAGNSSGFASAAWETDGIAIFTAVYDGSTWSSSVEISDGIDNDSPHIAADENNNAIAVWENSESSCYIYAAVYTHGSGWDSPRIISSNGRAAGADPQIGFDGSGNAIAVWEENDGFNRTIYTNRYTADSGWGTDTMIGNLTGEAHDPQIAVNSAGKAVVIWEQEESGSYNIYAAQYIPSSGTWMPAKLLESDSGDSRYGRVAIDNNGYAIAIWQYDDGSYTSIKAARLR